MYLYSLSVLNVTEEANGPWIFLRSQSGSCFKVVSFNSNYDQFVFNT